MSLWRSFSMKVRRRETPVYDALYKAARRVRNLSMPVIPGVHSFLYHEWAARTSAWHNFWRFVYYEPMFKSQCREVGRGFKLWYAGNGICRILGNLHIRLGDNVTMFDNMSLVGLRVFDDPEFVVGSNSYIGPLTRFMVARSIRIGAYCILGSEVMMTDNPGHPVGAKERCVPGGGLPAADSVHPVVIGDFCWIPTGCCVYPGAVVGDGVVAKLHTHIKGVIPSFSLIGGHPCRIERLLPIPEGLREMVGEERFAAWQKERQDYLAAHPDITKAIP